ncbi:MAG: NAD(P)/FAD-dependent oxidoreductase [Candidatus Auribacterota bacterium]|nr:NAD(P)/FAD-dependent oxidoreductase [Candidatus Auribacterota bacterium]
MEKVDITVVGAGVVGLAIAAELSGEGKEIVVVERHDGFGREASSRNSEVVHAGIYYLKDFFKTRLCTEGRRILYELSPRVDIPIRKCGKLIIAIEESDLQVIEALKNRAEENGVEGLRLLSRDEVRAIEPRVRAAGGLWSSGTGIIDSHRLMAYLEKKASGDTTFAYNCELIALEKKGEGYLVRIRDADGENYEFLSRIVINSAGLGAEKVALMAGIDTTAAGYTIYPCKGEYFRVGVADGSLFSHLVYPPPTDISLGLHTVVDLQGGMKIGPSAFYVDDIDYTIDEQHREDFFLAAQKYLPDLQREHLSPDMAGIRTKLYRKGEAERDFVIHHEEDRGLPGLINLIGIESPGLTASPAIGRYVKKLVEELL